MTTSVFRKLTPVLIVDAIEPCLPFWTDRLGFATVATVPHGDAIGFAILVKDGVEVMYQTRASAAEDNAASAPAAVEGMELVVPRRRTFYGMDELGVREPGGRVVMFAQPVADAESAQAVEPTGT